jgi:hypothetical protein
MYGLIEHQYFFEKSNKYHHFMLETVLTVQSVTRTRTSAARAARSLFGRALRDGAGEKDNIINARSNQLNKHIS